MSFNRSVGFSYLDGGSSKQDFLRYDLAYLI